MWLEPEGLGLHFWAGSTFFQCWMNLGYRSGSKPEGLELYYWAGFFPSQVLTLMPMMTMMVSTLARGWTGASAASIFSNCVHSSGNGALSIAGSSIRASSAGARAHCRLRVALGWPRQASHNTWQFSICCLHAWTGSKQIYAYALQEHSLSFLQPSGKPHWFSNQLRGLVFPVLDSRAGVPKLWLKPLLQKEDLQACDATFLFWVTC